MSVDTQIWTDIDYERNGKQFGTLRVPQSLNAAGWANLFIPIAVIKNGEGPTAVVFGGNHGDEYVGEVMLMNLARALNPDDVRGRIIIVPMLNRPAAEAGTRLSPLDGRNMNRVFPGQRNDTVTGVIAHYASHVLIPMANLVLDVHDGATTQHFLPLVTMHNVQNKEQMQKMIDTGMAWGASYVFVYCDISGEGLLTGYAESLGKVALGTEIGSAAQFGREMLAIAERGVRNALKLHGILKGKPEPAKTPKVVAADEPDYYVMAPVSGLFEPFFEMGDEIAAGTTIGQMHSTERPFDPPTPIVARKGGMLISRRSFPLTRQGYCVATLVRPFKL